jgi:hypothetical protein
MGSDTMRRLGWVISVFVLLACTSTALGQAAISFARLNGTVLNENKGVIVKASVTLRAMDTNRVYTTT